MRIPLHLAAVAAAAVALAGPSQALEFKSGDRAEAHGEFADSIFLAGEDVSVRATTPDDVFAAGSEVTVTDAAADHLFAAGGTVRMVSGQARDVIAAGGQVRLDGGQVEDDVIVMGGSVGLTHGFSTGGSAVLAGARVTVEADVGGDLRAAGENVLIDSAVAGDVELAAERLVIGPNARIGGNLSYRAETVEISPRAVVAGTTTARKFEGRHAADQAAGMAVGAAAAGLLLFALGCAVVALAAVAVFPGLMKRAAARLETWPLSTVGIGFLVALLSPALLALLFITVIGAPLALTAMALLAATVPLALASVAYWLGMKGRRLARRGASADPGLGARLGWTLLAVVALVLVGAIPVAGVIVWLLAYIVGLGAVAVEGRKALAAP